MPDGSPAAKVPMHKAWQRMSFNQDDMIRHMEKGNNVGVRLGDGWLVVDYDPRNDPTGNALMKFFTDFGLNPASYSTVITGSGGKHVYMRVPKDFHGRNALVDQYGKGVEFKGRGRQVVSAGSVHNNGVMYRFEERTRPFNQTGDAPAALLDMLKPKAPASASKGRGADGFGAFTDQQIADALSRIDVTRFGKGGNLEWFTLMCACHWASGGGAREEFISWSTSDPAYSDQGDAIRLRWDSLSQGGSGMTAKSGYLFKCLAACGVSQTEHPRERASVLFDDIEPADLVVDAPQVEGELNVLEEMNAQHAFVLLQGQPHYLARLWVPMMEDYKRGYIDIRALKQFYANKMIVVDQQTANGPKRVEMTWADYWVKHPQRRQYDGADFVPGADSEIFKAGGRILNLWEGWPYDPNVRGRGDWGLFKELIWRVIASENEEMFEYILNWMAYSLQNPSGPQKTALVMRGPKRIGKGFFATRWTRLFGDAAYITDDGDDLYGKYNAAMESTCALFLDEGYWAGNREAEGKIKARLTEPSIRTEQKYLPARLVKNHLKVMMATNNQWVVPATKDETRYCITDCAQVWEEGDPFFARCAREMDKEGGMQAMFYDLMHRDIGDWKPQQLVRTDALREQVRITTGPLADWWLDALDSGRLHGAVYANTALRDAADDGATPDWEHHHIAVPMAMLKDRFRDFLQRGSGRAGGDWLYRFETMWGPELDKMMPAEFRKRVQLRLPSDETFAGLSRTARGNVHCYILPPIGICKAAAEKIFGAQMAPMGGDDEDDSAALDALIAGGSVAVTKHRGAPVPGSVRVADISDLLGEDISDLI
jgi:hypothetical protein